MKLKLFGYILLLSAVSSVLLSSCIKNDVKELGNAGSTFVKLFEAPTNKLFFEPYTGVRNVSLVNIRRDANSNAELNKSVTVTLKVDPAAVTAYNTAHPTDTYEMLPDSLFTLVGSGITKTGAQTYQVVFSPGEFAKDFMIGLNGSKWDLSKKYAFPFTIDNPGGLKISSDLGTTLSFISIKNKWDGIYSILDGYVQRYTDPATAEVGPLNGSVVGNPDLVLATVGPNTVEISGLQWAYGNNSGVGGIANLRLTVDPATNKVSMSALGNPTLANWEAKDNYYNPATKTFYLNFRWNPTANRREYSVTIKYKGPR